MPINPLLFIPSPRDIPEFKEATAKLKIDKLWYKYFPQEEAYEYGRAWFMQHPEYTHFVILPDDLIVTQAALDILSFDAENYDVISGWCNNTAGNTDNIDTNFSLTLPPFQTMNYELYNFYKIADVKNLKDIIIPVIHQGTALTFISRSIVESIPFRGNDGPPDLCLSYDLFGKEITQYIDLMARCLHLRRPDILVGERDEEMIYEQCKQ